MIKEDYRIVDGAAYRVYVFDNGFTLLHNPRIGVISCKTAQEFYTMHCQKYVDSGWGKWTAGL